MMACGIWPNELKTRMTVALDDLGRADIDDRRPLPLCQFGEVGQLPNLGMPGDREHHHEKIKQDTHIHTGAFLCS